MQAYLVDNFDAFDLFSPTRPFYQVADLTALSGETKSVALLRQEAATGNNVPLFADSTETSAPIMRPAEAARRLIAVQCYDTAGIKTGAVGDLQAKQGKAMGNPVGPLGQVGLVALIGRNLFETLLLNLPPRPISPADRPAWRADPAPSAAWEVRLPLGDMDLATWQSRRLRLHPNIVDDELVVTSVVVCAGDRLPYTPDLEWRTGWRRVERPKPGEPALRPRRWMTGRAAWRGLAATVTGAVTTSSEREIVAAVIDRVRDLGEDLLPVGYPLGLQIVGVEYGNQSAVIEHVIADRTPLPLMALNDEEGERVRRVIELMVLQADSVARALNTYGDNLRLAVGGEKVPWDKGQRLGDTFHQGLSADAYRLLLGLSGDPSQADASGEAWRVLLRRRAALLADQLSDQMPAKAWLGHGEDGKKMRQQNADAFFHSALNKALPAPDSITIEGVSDAQKEQQ